MGPVQREEIRGVVCGLGPSAGKPHLIEININDGIRDWDIRGKIFDFRLNFQLTGLTIEDMNKRLPLDAFVRLDLDGEIEVITPLKE